MKNLLRRAAPLLAVGSLLSFASPTPALAHTDVCSGHYTMTAGSGLGAPVLGGPANTTFRMALDVGACAVGPQFVANGTLSGFCAQASGTGITTSGHSFTFTLAVTKVVFTGQVTGVLTLAPDPTGGSCAAGTANRFLMDGSLVLSH